jgi:hypothetical protein
VSCGGLNPDIRLSCKSAALLLAADVKLNQTVGIFYWVSVLNIVTSSAKIRNACSFTTRVSAVRALLSNRSTLLLYGRSHPSFHYSLIYFRG